MVKVVEFEDIYLEYPDDYELQDETKEVQKYRVDEEEQETLTNESVISESRTTRFSLEELQQKLEETQTLHL